MKNDEQEIRNALRKHWETEIRKEQILEGTLSMNPELCRNLDEVNSEVPLSQFQIETHKEITLS